MQWAASLESLLFPHAYHFTEEVLNVVFTVAFTSKAPFLQGRVTDRILCPVNLCVVSFAICCSSITMRTAHMHEAFFDPSNFFVMKHEQATKAFVAVF